MQLGKQDIGLIREQSIRHLVAYDQDTANGAGALLAEISDVRHSLGSADMDRKPFFEIVSKRRSENFERYEGGRVLKFVKRS